MLEYFTGLGLFGGKARSQTKPRKSTTLQVEVLENRLAPATLTWTGNISNSWDKAGNWEQIVGGVIDTAKS